MQYFDCKAVPQIIGLGDCVRFDAYEHRAGGRDAVANDAEYPEVTFLAVTLFSHDSFINFKSHMMLVYLFMMRIFIYHLLLKDVYG